MMNIANWIIETTAGLPENERKKYAARAVDDLMKNFDQARYSCRQRAPRYTSRNTMKMVT